MNKNISKEILELVKKTGDDCNESLYGLNKLSTEKIEKKSLSGLGNLKPIQNTTSDPNDTDSNQGNTEKEK